MSLNFSSAPDKGGTLNTNSTGDNNQGFSGGINTPHHQQGVIAGTIADATGMMDVMNYANNNNIVQQASQTNVNANMNMNTNMNTNTNMNMNMNVNMSAAAVHNINVNEFIKLQQQLQQQFQQQLNASNMNIRSISNPQNINPTLTAVYIHQNQQQQQQHNDYNNKERNPTDAILKSFIDRTQQTQFSGGMAGGIHSAPMPLQVPAQVNSYQNPIYDQLMMANQQNGMELMGNIANTVGAGALTGHNHSITPVGVGVAGNAIGNGLQLPSPNNLFSRDGNRRMRGGVIEPFPEKLHRLLLEVEAAGRADVISFVANGRAFAIHKADNFFTEIVPLYFRQSRLSSFKRQLNLYGFELINTGPARGGYYHELFLKKRPELCRRMRRVAVKVTPTTTTKNSSGNLSENDSVENNNNINNNDDDGTSTKHVATPNNTVAKSDVGSE